MPEQPVRAKDAQIVHSHQAVCYRPGCTWTGPHRPSYQAANRDRQEHLAAHAKALGGSGGG